MFLLICAAAWFDQRRENPALYRLLDGAAAAESGPTPPGATARELDGLKRATTWKWALLLTAFAVIGLMAAAHGGGLGLAVAASYLVFAAVGFAGLFLPGQRPLLEFAFTYLIGLPLLLTGYWLTRP